MAAVGFTAAQILHFLCTNLKLRSFLRDWCFAQYDMADLESTRLADQSHSRANINESRSEPSTKKIKVKYPLFLTKHHGNMFRRAKRDDVKTQASARDSNSGQAQYLGADQTQSAVFGQLGSNSTKNMDIFRSNSAIVITESGKDQISEQFVAKEKIESPLGSARFKYTITHPDDEPTKKEEKIPELPDDALDDETLCTICYSQKSNTVLLDCGHGGICIDCATDTMKKNNHCLFCRQRVVQIIEIETSEFKRGLYKVINSFYVSDGTFP